MSSILNGRNAWLEGALLTQQRKREKEMGPYWESRVTSGALEPREEDP
jgi:hypothetical protein